MNVLPTFQPDDAPVAIAAAVSAGAAFTVMGGRFYPLPVLPEHVDTEVILHALSKIQRYNGQLLSRENPTGWTVAQHTLTLAWWASETATAPVVRELLIHDWPEAWVGDAVTGVKRRVPALRKFETLVEAPIRERLGLAPVTKMLAGFVHGMDVRIVPAELAVCGPPRLQAVANRVHGEPNQIALEQVRRVHQLNELDVVSALARLCQQHDLWVTHG